MSSDGTMDTGQRVICPHESTGLCRNCLQQHAGWGSAALAIARPALENMALEAANAENARLRERVAALTAVSKAFGSLRNRARRYSLRGMTVFYFGGEATWDRLLETHNAVLDLDRTALAQADETTGAGWCPACQAEGSVPPTPEDCPALAQADETGGGAR